MIEAWEYKHAKVMKGLSDGDTFWADLDYGSRLHHYMKIRLKGVYCFELKSLVESERLSAAKSKRYLNRLLPIGTEVTITSKRLDKYGRLESIVIRKSDGLNINDKMIESGNATAAKSARLKLIK